MSHHIHPLFPLFLLLAATLAGCSTVSSSNNNFRVTELRAQGFDVKVQEQDSSLGDFRIESVYREGEKVMDTLYTRLTGEDSFSAMRTLYLDGHRLAFEQ